MIKTLIAFATVAALISSAHATEPVYVGSWMTMGAPCADAPEQNDLLITSEFIETFDTLCAIVSADEDESRTVLQIDCNDGQGQLSVLLETPTPTMLRFTNPYEPTSVEVLHRCDRLEEFARTVPPVVEERAH